MIKILSFVFSSVFKRRKVWLTPKGEYNDWNLFKRIHSGVKWEKVTDLVDVKESNLSGINPYVHGKPP